MARFMTFQKYLENVMTTQHSYRVDRNPDLLYQVANLPGIDIEMDPDEQGGLIKIDTIGFPKTAAQLTQLAQQKKIRAVAGAATKDITGQAMDVNTRANRLYGNR